MIDGFRSARFGMTRAEVQAAIAHDFSGRAMVAEPTAPDATVRALRLTLLRLNPGPGPADIVYLFDAATDQLVQVNVGWTSPTSPTDDERLAIAQAGARLQSYLREGAPRGCARNDGGVVDPATLLLFRAADERGSFIELVAGGVRFQTNGGAAPPRLAGPATLRLTYARAD